jgi:hypothetical protein
MAYRPESKSEMTETTIDTVPTSATAAGKTKAVTLKRTSTPKTRTKATAKVLLLPEQPEASATEQVLVPVQKPEATTIDTLTASDRERYYELKDHLRSNFVTGYEACVVAGQYMQEIKNRQLFKAEYGSWREFLNAEYGGISRSYAARQVQAANLEKLLELADVPHDHRPKTESQARELRHIAPNTLSQVVFDAHQLAGAHEVTANHFRIAATDYKLVSDKPARQKRAKEDAPKSGSDSVTVTPEVAYDPATGDLTISFDESEYATASISLMDLVIRAGIPEAVVREALYACFGSANDFETDARNEVETTLGEDDLQTEPLAA